MPKRSPFEKYADLMVKKGVPSIEWSFPDHPSALRFVRRGRDWAGRRPGRPYAFRIRDLVVTMYTDLSDPGPNRWHFDDSIMAGRGEATYNFASREEMESCRFAAYSWRRYHQNGAVIRSQKMSITITLPFLKGVFANEQPVRFAGKIAGR